MQERTSIDAVGQGGDTGAMKRAFGALLSLSWLGCSGATPEPARLPPKAVVEPPRALVALAAPPASPACSLAKDLAPLPLPLLDRAAPSPSPKNLRAYVETLADPALHGRAAGSAETRRVAELVARQLASFGLSAREGGDFCAAFERNGVHDQNVIGRLAHRGDENAPAEILVGAHYDAQGERGAEVFPGADDNASGVAVLLEVARVAALRGVERDLVFAAFGAEERGALGSFSYVDAERPNLSKLRMMINLDMVGRPLLDGSPLRLVVPRADEALGFVVGEREKDATRALLDRAAVREDRPIFGIPESFMTRLGYFSDSVPFGPFAPTIFLSDGALGDYHQPTDVADSIDVDQMERAARLVLAIVDELEKEPMPPP